MTIVVDWDIKHQNKQKKLQCIFFLNLDHEHIGKLNGPVHEIKIHITSASRDCSGESAHMCRLAGAFSDCIRVHKVLM